MVTIMALASITLLDSYNFSDCSLLSIICLSFALWTITEKLKVQNLQFFCLFVSLFPAPNQIVHLQMDSVAKSFTLLLW